MTEKTNDIKCENCKYFASMFNVCTNENVYEVYTTKYHRCPLGEKKTDGPTEDFRKEMGWFTEQEKGYTKADYIMALHKEYGCDLKTAEKAHNMALEYLRSLSKMKG